MGVKKLQEYITHEICLKMQKSCLKLYLCSKELTIVLEKFYGRHLYIIDDYDVSLSKTVLGIFDVIYKEIFNFDFTGGLCNLLDSRYLNKPY